MTKPTQFKLLEPLLIIVVLLAFTPTLWNFSSERIRGGEFSYLINSAAIADKIYDMTGAIPQWNPFIGRGEPLIENPFSFVLNPVMTLPIFAFGAVQGAKVGIILHILLMGVGGWLLAEALHLGRPGRLLLALLLGGSGSMAGAISAGFYQMGLSQAYVPWIFAALLLTLNTSKRWPVALLALSATLMLFAGTFWYVLPTVITAALLVLMAFLQPEMPRMVMIRRLLVALLLTLGLVMVRLLPQFVHHSYVDHKIALLEDGMIDFFALMGLYFRTTLPQALNDLKMYYHHILTPFFTLILLMGYGGLRVTRRTSLRWKIIIPAGLSILLFTVWAQEGTPFLKSLYDAVPLLREWRFLGRMMAAATPWIAVLAAIAFDELMRALREVEAVQVRRAGIALMLLISVVSVFSVLQNWNRITGTEPNASDAGPLVYYLRANHPQDFLTIQTWNYFNDYLPFYDVLARAAFGNPDYKPGHLPITTGAAQVLDYYPEYIITSWDIPFDELPAGQYRQLASTPDVQTSVLWESTTIPTYAYTVPRNLLVNRRNPLTRQETMPITTFTHNINSIRFVLDDYQNGMLLVVTETAYPGWQVRIDGEKANLEVVGGLLGVLLPPRSDKPVEIVFAYIPVWLHIGGLITLLSAAAFIAYLLLPGAARNP